MAQSDSIAQKIPTCFFTDNLFYVCFYTDINKKLTIWVYNTKKKNNPKNDVLRFSEDYDRRFYKGIHFKKEIGFFAYFKHKGNIPSFSLYQIKNDRTIVLYKSYSDITTKQGTFYNIDLLCDLLYKANNFLIYI